MDKPFFQFRCEIVNVMQTIRRISKPTVNRITHDMHDDLLLSLKENKFIAEHETDYLSIVNTVDDDKIEEEKVNDNENNDYMITRSKTRRLREKLNKRDRDYDYQNAEFNDIRDRMKTRDELMHDLFGHRRDFDIYNVKRFIEYQQGDNVLQLLKKCLQTDETEIADDTDRLNKYDSDKEFIRQWDPHLYLKFIANRIRIDANGVLQAEEYNESSPEYKWPDIVPFNIRGKVMDYAHHNLQCHHYHWYQSYFNLKQRYWWGTLKHDIRNFCERCLTCQFTKGSVRHRSPLRIRDRPKPRDHIFCDFLGPVYANNHILVIVDYATGYTMLIPTEGTDALTIVDALMTYWIPFFGWFSTIETDWGPGFNSQLIKSLMKASGIKLELAEPRNHRSIGKVERVIGFIQKILNSYNLLLGEKLTNDTIQRTEAWRIIETILPFINFGINQHHSRFTTFSPNQLMFGTNMKDISDIGRLQSRLETEQQTHDKNSTDFQYFELILLNIKNQLNYCCVFVAHFQDETVNDQYH